MLACGDGMSKIPYSNEFGSHQKMRVGRLDKPVRRMEIDQKVNLLLNISY